MPEPTDWIYTLQRWLSKTSILFQNTDFLVVHQNVFYLYSASLYNEKDILSAVARGDEHAFRQLFNTYNKKIFSFAMYLTRSEAIAEEITQDVFLKIWLNRSELAGISYFNSYLKKVARNVAYNYLKRHNHEKLILKELAQQSPYDGFDAETMLQTKTYQQLLFKAIEQLPPQQKKVYLLSNQQGLSYDQIAHTLQLSRNTIKNHMKQALRSIRTYMSGHIDTAILIALALFIGE